MKRKRTPVLTFPIPRELNVHATLPVLVRVMRGNVTHAHTIETDRVRKTLEYQSETRNKLELLESYAEELQKIGARYEENLRAKIELSAQLEELRKDDLRLKVDERKARKRLFDITLRRLALEDPLVRIEGATIIAKPPPVRRGRKS